MVTVGFGVPSMVTGLLILAFVIASDARAGAARDVFSTTRDTLDIEELIGELDVPDAEYAYVSERLEELREQPIDLNVAGIDELMSIPFISTAEAMSIVRHRDDRGRFSTEDSLEAVRGLDVLVAKQLRPFVVVHTPDSAAYGSQPHPSLEGTGSQSPSRSETQARIRIKADLIQRWTRKIERADGFRRDSSGYLGSPDILQTRLRLRIGRISTGVTLDKDAGEPMQWKPDSAQFGYDFAVGHVAVTDLGWIRRLVIGDYSARFAFGNILRSPGGIGSSTSSPAIRGNVIRPFASSAETGHFRGLAIELRPHRSLTFSGFASRHRFDARVDTSDGSSRPLLLRRSTGLHRTETERVGRNALSESVLGGGLRFVAGPFVLAGMAYVVEDRLDGSRLPGNFEIKRRTTVSSFAAGAALGDLHVSTELTPGGAQSAAMEYRAGRIGVARLRFRRTGSSAYLPHSAYSGASNGRTDAETQAITQLRVRPLPNTLVDLRIDHTRRSARSNRRPFSSTRTSGIAEVRHEVTPWFVATLRGTHRVSEDPDLCSSSAVPFHEIRCLSAAARKSFRLQLEYRHSRSIESRMRIEHVRSETAASGSARGMLVYQDIRFHPNERITLLARACRFTVDDHQARIYTYENDLLYSFSSPSFSGRGRRSFVFLRIRPLPAISLEVKWSTTRYEDVKTIGSGRDEISGNRLREIRFQLRWRLYD